MESFTKHCRYSGHACIRLKQPLLRNMAAASVCRCGTCCAHCQLQTAHLEAGMVPTAQHGLCQHAQAHQLGCRHHLQTLLPIGSRGWPTNHAGALICRLTVYRQQVPFYCAYRKCLQAQAFATLRSPPSPHPLRLSPPPPPPRPAGAARRRRPTSTQAPGLASLQSPMASTSPVAAQPCRAAQGEALRRHYCTGNNWQTRHD